MIGDIPVTICGYIFFHLIGKGGFSTLSGPSGSRWICAKVSLLVQGASDHEHKSVESAIITLTTLNHPHIVRLYENFHADDRFDLILKLCKSGASSSQRQSMRRDTGRDGSSIR
jgi:serine/threonine protein kinase